jgi:ubiquitin-conjugating enzyme E2 J1
MNPSHPAVKRIAQEARNIQEDPSDFFVAHPLETDLFDWHFTILGPDESAFAGGL